MRSDSIKLTTSRLKLIVTGIGVVDVGLDKLDASRTVNCSIDNTELAAKVDVLALFTVADIALVTLLYVPDVALDGTNTVTSNVQETPGANEPPENDKFVVPDTVPPLHGELGNTVALRLEITWVRL